MDEWKGREIGTGIQDDEDRELEEREEINSLSRFIAQSAPFGLVLAAAEDIPDQAFPAEQAFWRWGQFTCRAAAVQAGLDQGKTPADPVAVAAVDKLVGAAREASLGCILPCRQPGDESWNVEVAVCSSSGSCCAPTPTPSRVS